MREIPRQRFGFQAQAVIDVDTLGGYGILPMKNHAVHKSQLSRLRRAHGQVEGVIRMVKEERYCVDILTQLRAARAALRRVEQAVLREHAEHCIAGAAQSKKPKEAKAKLAELFRALERYAD